MFEFGIEILSLIPLKLSQVELKTLIELSLGVCERVFTVPLFDKIISL